MEMSVVEAAQYLKRTKRQIRYLIAEGQLPAKKSEGRWVIARKDLDALPGVKEQIKRKRKKARQIVEKVLGEESGESFFTVLDLRAFVTARDLCRNLTAENPAYPHLFECLQSLVCGCHAFAANEKRQFFMLARQEAARALAFLLLKEEPHEAATTVEAQLIPAISGLIRGQERRKQ